MRPGKLFGIAILGSVTLCVAASQCKHQSGVDDPSHSTAHTAGGGKEERAIRRGDRLSRFASEEELARFADEARLKYEKLVRGQRNRAGSAEPSPPPAADAQAQGSEDATGLARDEGITNNQEQGVDEGGIVKARGDHLIVLRRGRLFSVFVGGGALRPVAMTDAFPPGAASNNATWYDEMLVHDDTIVVIGFNYGAQATELGIFHFGTGGEISHRATYYLRSNDYYSSRNYASRLVGGKLVFYMPYRLFDMKWNGHSAQVSIEYPGLRRWDSAKDDWSRIIRANQIYRPVQPSDWPVLHTVVTCDLATPALSCDARGIIGPYSDTFYVSTTAIYLWNSDPFHWREPDEKPLGAEAPATLYRMPLDGSELGAIKVKGAPIDQFSFKESDGTHLNVMLRAFSHGDGMWAPEKTQGAVSLARIPLHEIGASGGEAPPSWYTALESPTGYTFQNRFAGDYVLYGTGNPWQANGYDGEKRVYLYPFRGGSVRKLDLAHDVERLEVTGKDAVVIGKRGGNLFFSSIGLGASPSLLGSHERPGLSQGEQRSHGFFYLPLASGGGMLGLPVRKAGSGGGAFLQNGSASVLFLGLNRGLFSALGELSARPSGTSDRCVASCVDWYGNARPIFYKGRIFALLGYELVEGTARAGSISEVARTDAWQALGR